MHGMKRWVLLVVVKEAIERVMQHAPVKELAREDDDRAEHLAAILRRWVGGEPLNGTEVMQRVCGIADIKPDDVRQALRS
jgi:hypothetical protein